jgi:hypothetical protein
MGDMTVGSGVRFAELSAVVTQACGCVVDLGVIASSRQGFWDRLWGRRPGYLKQCAGGPLHRNLNEVMRGG